MYKKNMDEMLCYYVFTFANYEQICLALGRFEFFVSICIR